MVHHDQRRTWSQRLGHSLEIDATVQAAGHHDHIHSGSLQGSQRPHDGIVFDAGRHHSVARCKEPVQRQVQSIGHVRTEHDTQWIRRIEELRKCFTCLQHDASGSDGQTMPRSAGVATCPLHELHHRLPYLRWLGPRCGCIVQVDHRVCTFSVTLTEKKWQSQRVSVAHLAQDPRHVAGTPEPRGPKPPASPVAPCGLRCHTSLHGVDSPTPRQSRVAAAARQVRSNKSSYRQSRCQVSRPPGSLRSRARATAG